MSCGHKIDAEYLFPSDTVVLDLDNVGDGIAIRFALPCPECDQPLELVATVDSVRETNLELPLEDVEEQYDD